MNNGMSHEEFQNYLGLLSRLLRLGATQREAIEDELRSHLEERFAALRSQGIEPARAVSMALAEFGDAAALAAEFSAVSKLRKRRWIMRFTMVSMAASVLAAAIVFSVLPDGSSDLADSVAQAQQVAKAPETKPEKEDPNSQTLTKLESLGRAEFMETPLQDVLDMFAEMTKVQMYVDHRALNDVEVTGQEPVTMNLMDLPVEMLLRLVLRQLDLDYMLEHGVVIITTPEEVERNLDIQVYRVDDLVEGPSARQTATFYGAGAYSTGETEFDQEDTEDGGYPRYERGGGTLKARYNVEALIGLITTTVHPESWENVGGPATIEEFRGALVVSQTLRGHRQIEKLLEGLREVIGQ